MPIYEFHCEACGQESELLLPSTDWSAATCPHCDSDRLNKALSVFSTSEGSSTEASLPPCSGEPASCGRCSLN